MRRSKKNKKLMTEDELFDAMIQSRLSVDMIRSKGSGNNYNSRVVVVT